MKKILLVFGIIISIVAVLLFMPSAETKYLRIHIRANSNNIEDTNIKHEIKDAVCEYLTPLFSECSEIEKAEKILTANLKNIERIVDSLLISKGFTYTSSARLNNEYFPTRSYKDLILESGYYDALIIDLGEAKGDNWWCVIYPPMCLADNTKNIVYKSKLLQIISKIFD
jgi:stage II sporulation protein R